MKQRFANNKGSEKSWKDQLHETELDAFVLA